MHFDERMLACTEFLTYLIPILLWEKMTRMPSLNARAVQEDVDVMAVLDDGGDQRRY